MSRARILVVVLLAAVAAAPSLLAPASAQADEASEKEARAAFDEGNALLEKGKYVEALEKFRAAYARWANPKILLNIGTTLRQLGRLPEAADVYEKYLGDPSADPKRVPEVKAALADLEPKVSKLTIVVTTPKTRVIVDGRVIGETGSSLTVRLEPGIHAVVGDSADTKAISTTIALVAGEPRTLELKPVDETAGAAKTETKAPDAGATPLGIPDNTAAPTDLSHAWRVGAFVRTDVDGKGRGVVVVPGVSYGIGRNFELALGGLIGRAKGGEVSLTAFVLDHAWKPMIIFAVPTFFSDGARPGARAGAGLEWDPSANFGLFVQASAAYFPSVPEGYDHTVAVFAAGLSTRL